MAACQLRIIPADAGSTLGRLVYFDGNLDHPRRCGEHDREDYYDLRDKGSSPQMRGALRLMDCLFWR